MTMRRIVKINKGVTLIELILVLAITSIVMISIFPMFFFGTNTYDSGKMQYDIQSNVRLASDVIRDRIRYVSDLAVIDAFDPSSADPNFNYIYLTENKKSIKFIEGNQIPVEIINSNSTDTSFELEFTKGSSSGDAIRFSNSIAAMSYADNLLKFKIIGQSAIESKLYELETEIQLLNTNSQIPDITIEGPIANPPEGEVPYGTMVSLTTAYGADIYYTMNGDLPTTSSMMYTNAISIVSDTSIKAIAVLDGISSTLAIYNYNISSNPLPEATSVNITGNTVVGQILTVNYSYSSKVEPVIGQGGSIINWYRTDKKEDNSDNITDLIHSSEFVEGDISSRQYVTNSADKGHYIYVEIIPKSINNTVGLPAWSTEDFGKIN